jgi:hypothetical protein
MYVHLEEDPEARIKAFIRDLQPEVVQLISVDLVKPSSMTQGIEHF